MNAFGFTRPFPQIVETNYSTFDHGFVLEETVFYFGRSDETPETFNMSSVRP